MRFERVNVRSMLNRWQWDLVRADGAAYKQREGKLGKHRSALSEKMENTTKEVRQGPRPDSVKEDLAY